jgi:hypothetical protein
MLAGKVGGLVGAFVGGQIGSKYGQDNINKGKDVVVRGAKAIYNTMAPPVTQQ